jgi:hypothetical protein
MGAQVTTGLECEGGQILRVNPGGADQEDAPIVSQQVSSHNASQTGVRVAVVGQPLTLTLGAPLHFAHPAGQPILLLVIDTPTPLPTSSASAAAPDDDSARHLTAQQRQQRQQTNRSGSDDVHTEGNVISTSCPSAWNNTPDLPNADQPAIVIANRDGPVVVRVRGDALATCSLARPGDYLEADGEKRNEQLYDADEITLTRGGQRVR